MELFEHAAQVDAQQRAPLAERMRPRTLDEYLGQEHVVGEGRLLKTVIAQDALLNKDGGGLKLAMPSMIFWGPPGSGKTTLAHIIANSTGAHFDSISAVLSGVKELREVTLNAQERFRNFRKRTILFVDEIHRFNKSQQDALLPHVEKGTFTLLGATTENPSFEVNAALLSRMRVITLTLLEEHVLKRILQNAVVDSRGLGGAVEVDDDALAFLAHFAQGDARRALTALEVAAQHGQHRVTRLNAEEAVQKKTLLYDKSGDEHFNVISAFIKCMRGNDVDGASYWMVRMVESGEDLKFIVRRLVVFASEDIGNADPQALRCALDCLQAVQFLGFPECTFALAQTVAYLSLAPKSNAALTTYAAAKTAVTEHGALPVPLHLRNAPTTLMKHLNYGQGYHYAHDSKGDFLENGLPEGLKHERFYVPSKNGKEGAHQETLARLRALVKRKEPGEDG
jgi:putative ATPase